MNAIWYYWNYNYNDYQRRAVINPETQSYPLWATLYPFVIKISCWGIWRLIFEPFLSVFFFLMSTLEISLVVSVQARDLTLKYQKNVPSYSVVHLLFKVHELEKPWNVIRKPNGLSLQIVSTLWGYLLVLRSFKNQHLPYLNWMPFNSSEPDLSVKIYPSEVRTFVQLEET